MSGTRMLQAAVAWFPTSISEYPHQTRLALVILPILYLLVCRLVRYRRVASARRKYSNHASFAPMTNDDATTLQSLLGELEFPFMFEKAFQFAIFRTIGIPSISKTLVKTTQLSNNAIACKRYSDTNVLISEFVGHPPDSNRARQAIARMNFIHSGYQKSGQIINDDLLYTLALFACEPVRWINKYEWRELEAFEVCALGTFWKSIGDAMHIDYAPLGEANWRDGLKWWMSIEEWSRRYEEGHMVPAQSNHDIAEETMSILLWTVPKPFKGFAKHLVASLMDERLRTAMMYPYPPRIAETIALGALSIRKHILRYLTLPRPSFMRAHWMSETPSADGTYHYLKYDAAPYYVKPTFSARFNLYTWYMRAMGLPVPGDQGDKFHPGGYVISEMGPKSFEGKGRDFMEKEIENLKEQRSGGCVFASM